MPGSIITISDDSPLAAENSMPQDTKWKKRLSTPDLDTLHYSETGPEFWIETASGEMRETWLDTRRPRKARPLTPEASAGDKVKPVSVLEKLQSVIKHDTETRLNRYDLTTEPTEDDSNHQLPAGLGRVIKSKDSLSVADLQFSVNEAFGMKDSSYLPNRLYEGLRSGWDSAMVHPDHTEWNNLEKLPENEYRRHLDSRRPYM